MQEEISNLQDHSNLERRPDALSDDNMVIVQTSHFQSFSTSINAEKPQLNEQEEQLIQGENEIDIGHDLEYLKLIEYARFYADQYIDELEKYAVNVNL